MPKRSPCVLIADDDQGVLSALSMLLEDEGYVAKGVSSTAAALDVLAAEEIDLLLMDLNYSLDTTSGREGLELINQIKQSDEQLPIVVMTGWGTIDVAVQAMQAGASDFIQKPWENQRLLTTVSNQIKLADSQRDSIRLSAENRMLKHHLHGAGNQQFVAASENMKALLDALQKVAHSDANILLTGENGTGKSLLANYIHQHSPRAEQNMVSVNMGALSESLFESEMFGHKKGAFTDAAETRIGRFELADQGTLFLDEIGNTPFTQQAKLLRVLEDRCFEKVGASKTQQVDIRLVSATNMDLQKAVEQGEFRADLLYRINTITLEVPPLRDRLEDIEPLARFFAQGIAEKYNRHTVDFGEDTVAALQAYHWPGNVRELSHVIERAVLLSPNDELEISALAIGENKTSRSNGFADGTLDEIEKQAIRQRLRHYDGNAVQAARSLGMSRSAFYRRLDKYQL